MHGLAKHCRQFDGTLAVTRARPASLENRPHSRRDVISVCVRAIHRCVKNVDIARPKTDR